MKDVVLDKLFKMTSSIDLNARHGSILAIAEVVLALSKNDQLTDHIKEETLKDVCDLIPKFRERLLFRGLGGELMKQACSIFIQKCSRAHLPFHGNSVINDWIGLLNESLSYEVPTVRMAAIEALPDFFTEYYREGDEENRSLIVNSYIENLKPTNRVTQMGHLLALGSLPEFMLRGRTDLVIDSVIKTMEITEMSLKWAESRRDALKALTMICNTIGTKENIGKKYVFKITFVFNCYFVDVLNRNVPKIFESFFTGLTEYTQDNRGDIGAWVREAAMQGIQALTLLLCRLNPSLLDKNTMTRIVAGLVQQAVEKIDRTRALAGRVFSSIIHR